MGKSKSNHNHSHSKRRKKNKRLKRQLIILLFVAILLGSGYYYITYYLKDNVYTTAGDTTGEYTLVHNQDSLQYQAIVIYNRNIDINTISKTFYKSDIFWPYIFIENRGVIKNPLNIEKDVVLKIPRLSDSIINLKNPVSVNRVKLLADSILESVTEPI